MMHRNMERFVLPDSVGWRAIPIEGGIHELALQPPVMDVRKQVL